MSSKSASELSCVRGRYNDFFLTNKGTIFGAYELSGVDPTGLGQMEREWCTFIMSSLFKHSPDTMTLTQYYIHQDNASIKLKERDQSRSKLLSSRREAFLNSRRLSSSRLFFLPEFRLDQDLNSFWTIEFFQNLLLYPLSATARRYIHMRMSEYNSILAYEDDLKVTAQNLSDGIQKHLSRLNLSSLQNRLLNSVEHWGLVKALHNFDFRLLDQKGKPASNYLHSRVFEGNVKAVNLNGIDYLKIQGLSTVYLRIASIKGFSDEYIHEATFARGINAPVSVKGNYVMMSRYRGMSKSESKKYFKNMEDDVQRNQINPAELLTGNIKSGLEKQLSMSDTDQAILKEVKDAVALPDGFGNYEAAVVIFGDDLDQINATCRELEAAYNQASIDLIFESTGLEAAFESFLPGSQFQSKREMVINSTKASALSLFYKASVGQHDWLFSTALGKQIEEALYIFESNDGSPFYYQPHLNGKCLIICIGPIRTGKTFLKNTIASHVMKYTNSFYTAIDIDPGTETLAKFFQEDGAIFRLDEDFQAGFNPFLTATGSDDTRFKAHFIRQLETMIKANSNEESRRFTRLEQTQIDSALKDILDPRLEPHMRTLETFLGHCNKDIAHKLARFHGHGMYSRLYDNATDAIGSLRKRFSVYNIMGVRDDPVLLPLVMNEIVYRVVRTFESRSLRDSFKMLDIDEAHAFLKIPGMTDFLVNGIRTWGKWNAGVSLSTQSPLELESVPHWPVLRSAASTLIFMADGEMNRDVYKRVFDLSDGHLDAIENLIPKQQAFIYQRDLRVAKVINLFVEPEQKVINTSVAGEVSVRDRNLNEFDDVDQAIQATIEELELA